MKTINQLILVLSLSLTAACSDASSKDGLNKQNNQTNSTVTAKKDIVDTAVGAGTFTTLVAAVQAAGLVDTLKSEGPFTVFAPTDAAFAALPEGTVAELLKPENLELLQSILLYHVKVGDTLFAEEVVKLNEIETATGDILNVKIENGSVFINESKVVVTDIKASNGVIHVIDMVLLP